MKYKRHKNNKNNNNNNNTDVDPWKILSLDVEPLEKQDPWYRGKPDPKYWASIKKRQTQIFVN